MKKLLLLVLLSVSILPSYASHFLGGYIRTEQITPLRHLVTLTTWTDPSAAGVDRCTVDFEIWNAAGTVKIGELLAVPRTNGPLFDSLFEFVVCADSIRMGEYIWENVKRNIYVAEFEFPGPGQYHIRHYETSWIDSLVNFSTPSGNAGALLETTILINPIIGANQPPYLQHDENFVACAPGDWFFDTGTIEPDGDSISFTQVDCRCATPMASCGYTQPGILGGGFFFIGPGGNFNWMAPVNTGYYAFAEKIEEWRSGVLISSTLLQRVVRVDNTGCTVQNDPAMQASRFSAWPNPVVDVLQVQAEGEVTVLNASGQIVLRKNIASHGTINLDKLPAGLYVVTHAGRSIRVVKAE